MSITLDYDALNDKGVLSPISGIRRFRFINRNIDRSKPNWRKLNMIEIYEVRVFTKDHRELIFGDGEILSPLFTDPDTGDAYVQEMNVFDKFSFTKNIILELYVPFLHIKALGFKDMPKGRLTSLSPYAYDPETNEHNEFDYDEENHAFIVDDVEELIKTQAALVFDEKTGRYTLNKRYQDLIDPVMHPHYSILSWQLQYGFVPIKSDESKETTSAWV